MIEREKRCERARERERDRERARARERRFGPVSKVASTLILAYELLFYMSVAGLYAVPSARRSARRWPGAARYFISFFLRARCKLVGNDRRTTPYVAYSTRRGTAMDSLHRRCALISTLFSPFPSPPAFFWGGILKKNPPTSSIFSSPGPRGCSVTTDPASPLEIRVFFNKAAASTVVCAAGAVTLVGGTSSVVNLSVSLDAARCNSFDILSDIVSDHWNFSGALQVYTPPPPPP